MKEFFLCWVKRYFSDPQIIILGFLLLLGCLLIYFLGNLLAPVLASLVIAYLLDGVADRLKHHGVPKTLSMILVFLLFMAGLMLLAVALLPMIWGQIAQLLQELPSMIAAGQKVLMRLPESYPEFVSEVEIRRLLDFVNRELTRLGQHILPVSIASVKGLITLGVYLVIVPLLVFFFLKDKKKILAWIAGFLPEERGLATEVWVEVNEQIGNYIRGKIWEILIVWAATYAVFSWLGLHFAMLLALFTGLSVLLPYVGVIAMFFPVVSIAYFQFGWGPEFTGVVLAYAIIQALDGNLLAPLLLAGVVNIHPVAIITAIMLFGGLWGFWGLVFAVPLATLIHAVLKAWFVKKQEFETEVPQECGAVPGAEHRDPLHKDPRPAS
jgi:putative permease